MQNNNITTQKNEINEATVKKDLMNLSFKQAQFYASSTIVPASYQNNPSNCFIAIQMANRMGADPFQVMQSLNVIKGKPSWSSQFIIAAINQSGRFKTQLNYKIKGNWKDKTLSCIAYATALDGTLCESIEVDYQMAKAEGWIDKQGSKWQTMPELMIRYRAASFFGKQFCPDLLLGLMSTEEQKDIIDADYTIVNQNQAMQIVEEEQATQEGKLKPTIDIPTQEENTPAQQPQQQEFNFDEYNV